MNFPALFNVSILWNLLSVVTDQMLSADIKFVGRASEDELICCVRRNSLFSWNLSVQVLFELKMGAPSCPAPNCAKLSLVIFVDLHLIRLFVTRALSSANALANPSAHLSNLIAP
jgi:hypothetical protein